MKRIYLIISGDVQGVGYRSWMRKEALNLGLTGWVKNREDGTVEAIAIGSEVKLKKLLELCQKGPEVAWVKNVTAKWSQDVQNLIGFEIRL